MFERISHFVGRFKRNEASGTESLVLPGQEQPVALSTAPLSESIETTEVLQKPIIERLERLARGVSERASGCADANSLVGMFIDTATEVQQSNSEIAALHASRDRTPGMGNLMKVGEWINAIDLQIAQIEKTRNTGLQYKAQAIIALATALSNRHEQMYEERRLAGDPTPTLPLRDFMQEARDQLEVLWGKLTPEDAVLDKKPEVGTATGQDAVGQAATTRKDASTAYIQTITDQGGNVDDKKVDPSNSMQPTVLTSVEQKREEQTREEKERVGKEATIKALSQQLGIDDTPIVVRRLHFLQDQATHATQDRERSSPLPNNFTDISDPAIRRLMQERANIVNADGILDLFLRVHNLLREANESDRGIRIRIANVLLGRVNELKKNIDPGNEQTRGSTQVGDVAHKKLDEGEDLDFLQEQFTEYTKENADVMAIIAAVRSRFVRKTPAQGIDQIKKSRPNSEGVAITSDGGADRETGTGTEGATAAGTGEAAGVSEPAGAAEVEPAGAATPPVVAETLAQQDAEVNPDTGELEPYVLLKSYECELPVAGDRWQEVFTTSTGDRVEWGIHRDGEAKASRLWVYDPEMRSDAVGGLLKVGQEVMFMQGKFVVKGEIREKDEKYTAHIELFQTTLESLQNFLRADQSRSAASSQRAADFLTAAIPAAEQAPEPTPVAAESASAPEPPAEPTVPGDRHRREPDPERRISPPKIELGARPPDLEPLEPQVIIKNTEGRGRNGDDQFTPYEKFNIRVASTQEKNQVYIQLLPTKGKMIEGLIADFIAETGQKELRFETPDSNYVIWGKAELYHESDGTPKVVYTFVVCKKHEQTQPSSTIAPSSLPHGTSSPGVTSETLAGPDEENKRVGLARMIQAKLNELGSKVSDFTHDRATDLGEWSRRVLSRLDRRGDGITQAQIESATDIIHNMDIGDYTQGLLFDNKRDGLRSLEEPNIHKYTITVGVIGNDSTREIQTERGKISLTTYYPGDQLGILFKGHDGHYPHPLVRVATAEVSQGTRMGSAQVSRDYGIRYTSRLTGTDNSNPAFPVYTYQCNVEVCSAIDMGGLTCSDSVREALKTEGVLLSDIPQIPYLQFLNFLDMHGVRRGDWSFGKFCALRDQACALLGITPVSVDLIGTRLNSGWLDKVEHLYKERKTAEVVDMIAMVDDPDDTVKALEILKKYELSYLDISYLLHHSDSRKAKAAVDTLFEMHKDDILLNFVNPDNQRVYSSKSAREYAKEKLKLFHNLE